jgi:hypothetical protein
MKIQARMILEILGRPPEHIKEAMTVLIQRLKSEPGVKILEENHHEPVPVQDSKDIFTTFSEIIFETDSVSMYFGIIFAYMPSNIELLSPQQISFSNADFNEITGLLSQRLHDYDAIAKRMVSERHILEQKLKEIAPHLFKTPSQTPQQIIDNQPTKKKSKVSKNKSKKR